MQKYYFFTALYHSWKNICPPLHSVWPGQAGGEPQEHAATFCQPSGSHGVVADEYDSVHKFMTKKELRFLVLLVLFSASAALVYENKTKDRVQFKSVLGIGLGYSFWFPSVSSLTRCTSHFGNGMAMPAALSAS